MVKRSYKPEETVSKIRQVDVLHSQGQGMTIADAVREIGVSEVTFYRWRKDYSGMKADQLKRDKGAGEGRSRARLLYISLVPRPRRKRASISTVQGAVFSLFLNSHVSSSTVQSVPTTSYRCPSLKTINRCLEAQVYLARTVPPRLSWRMVARSRRHHAGTAAVRRT